MSEEIVYRRVNITGYLQLKSDLHLGTGVMQQDDDSEHEFNAIAMDGENKPYLCGASLRGLLASLSDSTHQSCWFGDAHGLEDDQGSMGALRIYDARLVGDFALTKVSRTSIEPVTGTAKQHHLATHQVVKSGAKFKVEIAFDTKPSSNAPLIKEGDIQALLQTLQGLSGAQLGTGKSVGQGVLEWELERVEGLSHKDFLAWLQQSLANDEDVTELVPLHTVFTDLSQTVKPLPASNQLTQDWITEDFQLYALSPLLINNPHDSELNSNDENKDSNSLHLIFTQRKKLTSKQDQGEAIILGSTLKGWFRARCRKILLTLSQGQCATTVDAMLDEIFGNKDKASAIRFYDATVEFSSDDEHTQIFNAVDRFTGGVKKGALYTVKALRLQSDQPFTAQVSYQKGKIKGWMQLLLLFAWRDAEDGDLVLGWGKAKGYGRLRLVSDKGGTQQWITKCAEHLDAWECDLHNELNKEVSHG